MRRRDRVSILLICVALLFVSGIAKSFAQVAQLRPFTRIVQKSSLPGIDRGFVNSTARLTARQQGMVTGGRAPDRAGASGRRYAAGRVIVKFRNGMTLDGRTRATSLVAPLASLRARRDASPIDVVDADASIDAEAVARSFTARADVEYAQADYRVEPRFVPNDTYYRQYQWNFPQIDMERAWDIQPGAKDSIVVALLDTGIAYENATYQFRGFAFRSPYNGQNYPALGVVTVPFARAPDLADLSTGSKGDGRFVAPYDFIWNDAHPNDMDGHGTHMAGTIGQLTNNGVGMAGIAFNVRFMPVKVLSTDWDDIFLSPEEGTDFILAEGIRYAADHGAQVINMSLGRSGPPAPAVEDAMRYAVGKGSFLALAGGNDFTDGNPVEVYAEIASRLPGAVSVAAVDPNRQHASYSNTGSWVEVAAPGGSDSITNGSVFQQTYDLIDLTIVDTFLLAPAQFRAPRFDMFAYIGGVGTSSSTAHVSGLAALLMQQGVKTPAAIEAAMERFATDLGAPGRDNEFGYGEISARNTLFGLGLGR
jgi:serine protease